MGPISRGSVGTATGNRQRVRGKMHGVDARRGRDTDGGRRNREQNRFTGTRLYIYVYARSCRGWTSTEHVLVARSIDREGRTHMLGRNQQNNAYEHPGSQHLMAGHPRPNDDSGMSTTVVSSR